MAERTVTAGPFQMGMNNRLRPTELEVLLPNRKNVRWLYGADNVDLTAEGGLKRREGFTSVLAGDSHSLWGDAGGTFAVVNDELCSLAVAGDTLVPTVLRTGLPKLPLSYTRAPNGIVYWSNGLELRCVVAGTDHPISAAPALAPTAVAASGGSLPEGLYIVAFTWTGPQGESAPTHAVQVSVPAAGRVDISDLGGGTVWMTGPNGDHLTSYGTTSSIVVLNPGGRVMRTVNTAPMPAGQLVRMHQGSLVVAQDNVLYVSVPYNNTVFQPMRGYVPFPSKITAMESVVNGFYICADKTYWVADFFGDAGLQEKLPFGAIFGSSLYSPEETKAYWQSPYGLVSGDNSGNVVLLQNEALSFPDASFGASMYRFRDGRVNVVTTRSGVQPNRAAALAWAEAEVIRKETSDEL